LIRTLSAPGKLHAQGRHALPGSLKSTWVRAHGHRIPGAANTRNGRSTARSLYRRCKCMNSSICATPRTSTLRHGAVLPYRRTGQFNAPKQIATDRDTCSR
jgi:hypothetical protein